MINTLTLNPAIDKILYVDQFTPNVTTRINRVVETIGGKGTHVSVNLAMMGEKSRAFGIAHGRAGARVVEMLEGEKGIDVRFLCRKEGETRTNYLLAEATGDSTLITERGVTLTEADLAELTEKLKRETRAGDCLALSGDASNYADPLVYNRVMDALSACGLNYFLDTSGLSLKESVQKSPFLIKPNLSELSTLCGYEVAADDESVANAIDTLAPYQIGVVAVSLGEKGSIVKYEGAFFRAAPPEVNAQNTVGCGDCYLAGLLYGFEKKMRFEDTLKFATAAGAAAAECPLSVGLDMARAKELMPRVALERF